MKLEFQNYKHLTWGPVAAILGTLGIFLGGQIVAGIFIFLALLVYGWDTSQITAWLEGGGTAQFILSIAVGFVTIGLLFIFLQGRRAKPSDLGWVRPRLRDAGFILMGIGAYVTLYIGVVGVLAKMFTSLDLEQQQDLGFSTDTTGNELALVFVALVVLPPLVEEILARGFLFSGLRKKMLFLPAAIISSGLFGLAHLGGGEGGSAIWIAVIDTFILGMVLAYLRERSGSLWPPIGLHAAKNLTAFLFLFVFKIA
jgi:membrane protease YdiL (CAAX protease family)